ncbi:MAG: Fe-S cluster assembly ATPase SufC [Candidatus Peribacteraceae bacterium]
MSPKGALLKIRDLHIGIDRKDVVKGLSLEVRPGEIHAIMGPNGSGKSTLVSTLMGHPQYQVQSGTATFHGKDLLAMEPDERARAGLFLAFQYPRDVRGVPLRSFLFAAYQAQMAVRFPKKKRLSPLQFASLLEQEARALHIDPTFLDRAVNHGFSGGEKKKSEVLQMRVLSPDLALLDETDSGLDVDALKIVAEGVRAMRSPTFSAVIVTHYARLLEYIEPDHVHVMVRGKLVESGDMRLARRLEKEGYAAFGVTDRIELS